MTKQHSPEEIEDYAMRMAWAAVSEKDKEPLRQMAAFAITVHEQLVERLRFNAIVNPTNEVKKSQPHDGPPVDYDG